MDGNAFPQKTGTCRASLNICCNSAICCCNFTASSLALTAKFSVLSAKIIPREEFTINPQWEFIPYLATSSKLPPCAPTPGTSKKWFGTISRIPLNISAFVAPTTYIIFWSFPHSWDLRKTRSYSFTPFSSKNWKSKAPLLEVNANKITHFPSYFRNGVTESSPM